MIHEAVGKSCYYLHLLTAGLADALGVIEQLAHHPRAISGEEVDTIPQIRHEPEPGEPSTHALLVVEAVPPVHGHRSRLVQRGKPGLVRAQPAVVGLWTGCGEEVPKQGIRVRPVRPEPL